MSPFDTNTPESFRANDHYSQILDSLSDMVLVKGPKSRLLWANRAFLEYYGMTNEQLKGIIDAPFNEPDYTQQYVKDDAQVFNTGKVLDISAEPVTRHDGQVRYFHTVKTPIFNAEGRVIMTVGVSRDITEKMAADKLVRENEARFKQLFADNLIGITVSTKEGKILDANDSFLKIVGYSREDREKGLLHRSSLTPFYYNHLDSKALEELTTQGFATPFEKEYFRKDGTAVPVLVGKSLLRESKDQIIAFVLDLSERKRQEQIIDEQRQRMITSSKLSALGEMSGGIAHEINNPLAIIHGKAGQLRELAEAGRITPSLIADTAGKIEKTATRISKIVKSLRAFARDGENDPFSTISVSALVDETIEFCTERFRNHEISLLVEEFPKDLTLDCRAVQLSQVLLNLLNNAHDAVMELTEKWVKLVVCEKGGDIHFGVTDSGKGVPAELRDKIMRPFFTTKEMGQGTGIGLSVSKGIIESHHGSLWLDVACPNTRFVATLPKRRSALQKKAA